MAVARCERKSNCFTAAVAVGDRERFRLWFAVDRRPSGITRPEMVDQNSATRYRALSV